MKDKRLDKIESDIELIGLALETIHEGMTIMRERMRYEKRDSRHN